MIWIDLVLVYTVVQYIDEPELETYHNSCFRDFTVALSPVR